jgi:O-methyltransferase
MLPVPGAVSSGLRGKPMNLSAEISQCTDDLAEARQAYIDLLKKILTRFIAQEEFAELVFNRRSWQEQVFAPIKSLLSVKGYVLCKRVPFDPEARRYGLDWPASAETMAGLTRLDNIEHCVKEVLRDEIPGDFVETGVWRGGSCILMRGILRAYGVKDRRVWLADSFAGLPKSTHREDLHWDFERYSQLAVSLEQVEENFRKYDLLDGQVCFLKGWFKDTLPSAPIEQIAVLRLDGDLYESTWDAISALYPKLAPGGFLIVDDYGGIDSCRKAIHDYRDQQGIAEPIQKVDQSCVYWRRGRL